MNAKELLYTGRTMQVAEAYQRGLVSRVVPADMLEQVGMEIAESIAAAPPLAMALTDSRGMRQPVFGHEVNLGNGIRIEMAAIERNLADGGWRAGIEKFSEAVGGKGSK